MVDKEKAAKLLTLGTFEYAVARLDLLYQRREDGKGLSQNDFTNELKAKLEQLNPDDQFATADEVDEVLDQYFPGDVDPDETTSGDPEEPGHDVSGEEADQDNI
ncbi:MAG: hypothetical protein IJ741_03740 [Schwartzia sp.]|nr:hypothetical protein [Schwartzia sp. (in: firmicutes)]